MRTRRRRPALIACSAFAAIRFPSGMIVQAVRWHLGFGLSYRDVEVRLAERGIQADHVTCECQLSGHLMRPARTHGSAHQGDLVVRRS